MIHHSMCVCVYIVTVIRQHAIKNQVRKQEKTGGEKCSFVPFDVSSLTFLTSLFVSHTHVQVHAQFLWSMGSLNKQCVLPGGILMSEGPLEDPAVFLG